MSGPEKFTTEGESEGSPEKSEGSPEKKPGTSSSDPEKLTAKVPDSETTSPRDDPEVINRIREAYKSATRTSGGNWQAQVSLIDKDGRAIPSIQESPDKVVPAQSVNKVPVAIGVLRQVADGQLKLDDKVELTRDLVKPSDDGNLKNTQFTPEEPSRLVSVEEALTELLTVSDDTASRLCGEMLPPAEMNKIMKEAGFGNTQLSLIEGNPKRFYMGTTTPREMDDLLRELVKGNLLPSEETKFMLDKLRSPNAFTDGIRHNMTPGEQGNVATKAGWFGRYRNEAGIYFDKDNAPLLTYSLFANKRGAAANNFSATNPLVEARATIGRAWQDTLNGEKPEPSARKKHFWGRN